MIEIGSRVLVKLTGLVGTVNDIEEDWSEHVTSDGIRHKYLIRRTVLVKVHDKSSNTNILLRCGMDELEEQPSLPFDEPVFNNLQRWLDTK